MADYSALESIFDSAIPQVWKSKYPDHQFTRTVHVTKDAEDNFVVTRTKVLISPKAIGERLDLFDFCVRITRACWDFDHLQEEHEKRLRKEFEQRILHDFIEIHKRWGLEGLADMIDQTFNVVIHKEIH